MVIWIFSVLENGNGSDFKKYSNYALKYASTAASNLSYAVEERRPRACCSRNLVLKLRFQSCQRLWWGEAITHPSPHPVQKVQEVREPIPRFVYETNVILVCITQK